MKKYVLAFALAAAAASPAFAASHKHHASAANASADETYFAPDSNVVVSGGQYLGRDPDPIVRMDLLRQGDAAEVSGN